MKQRGGKSIHKYAMNHHHEPVWDNLCKQLERGKKRQTQTKKTLGFSFSLQIESCYTNSQPVSQRI